MSSCLTLLGELDGSPARKSVIHRAKALGQLADLFTANARRLTAEQVALFDEVMGRLIQELDKRSRLAFSEKIVAGTRSPPAVLRDLALDDDIEIAGPLLTSVPDISEETLVEGASTKGQDHLLAISRRASLSEAVTDVLVDRGSQEVVVSTVENRGARLSTGGYAAVVHRAQTDADLAVHLWMRPDVPAEHLAILFETAAESLQRELQAMNPDKADDIRRLVLDARLRLQSEARARSPHYAAAHEQIKSLHESGQLREQGVLEFARAKKFDEVCISLGLLCDVPIGAIDRALNDENLDQLVILARAISLSWGTVSAIATMRHDEAKRLLLKDVAVSFDKLNPATAKTILQYYRLREQAFRGKSVPLPRETGSAL
jgi:uncharacterized protein (DUF2336 family)